MLAKTKLTNTEVLISIALIDWYINHDKFVLVNNALREYNDMKEGNKKLRLQQFIKDFNLIIKQRYCIVYSVERKQTVKTEKVQR